MLKLEKNEVAFWKKIYATALERFLSFDTIKLLAADSVQLNAQDFATKWADNSVMLLRQRLQENKE